jgi:hypothetical protein
MTYIIFLMDKGYSSERRSQETVSCEGPYILIMLPKSLSFSVSPEVHFSTVSNKSLSGLDSTCMIIDASVSYY